MTTEHYDEEKLEHQEPVVAISEWQAWNDLAVVIEWEKHEAADEQWATLYDQPTQAAFGCGGLSV